MARCLSFFPFVVLFSCYIFTNHQLNNIPGLSKSSNHFFFIYPCRLIMLHRTQVLVCSMALKPLLKRNFSEYFLLIFILFIILLHLNNVLLFFNFTQTKNTTYLQLLTKVPNMTKITIFLFLCLPNLLFHCGDIEANSGTQYSSLKFCSWNLNGLTAHDSIKISLLQAYITQFNYDIICLSEKFLNSSIKTSGDRISIDGYILIRADHPSDSNRSRVCINCIKSILL